MPRPKGQYRSVYHFGSLRGTNPPNSTHQTKCKIDVSVVVAVPKVQSTRTCHAKASCSCRITHSLSPLTHCSSPTMSDVILTDSNNSSNNSNCYDGLDGALPPTGHRVLYAFNKFLANFVIYLRKTHPDVKQILRAEYRVIDNLATSVAHVEYFEAHAPSSLLLDLASSVDWKDTSKWSDAHWSISPLRNLDMRTLFQALEKTGQEGGGDTSCHIWCALGYVAILGCIAHVYRNVGDQSGEKDEDALLDRVLGAASSIRYGKLDDVDDALEGVLDDDVVNLLEFARECERMRMASSPAPASSSAPTSYPANSASVDPSSNLDEDDAGFVETLSRLESSKIGSIAKEITQEIDTSKLDMNNPMDLLNFGNLSDGSSLLGDIVNRVGSKIHSKISSGELKQDELLGEAMSLLTMMDGQKGLTNNPLFSELMKMTKRMAPGGMGDMGGGSSRSSGTGEGRMTINQDALRRASTRDRLRQRLSEKNASSPHSPST